MQNAAQTMPSDRRTTNLELWSLYDIQRTATLNIKYYGARAAKFEFWNLLFQVVASIGSLSAVGAFLALGGTGWGKWAAAIVGLLSGVSAALPSVLGFSDRINRFERLHFSYCQLFHMAKALALDIRRSISATEQQLGASKAINDLYSRLGHLDETDPKSKLSSVVNPRFAQRFPRKVYGMCERTTAKKEPEPQPEPEKPQKQDDPPERIPERRPIPLTEREYPLKKRRIEPGSPWDEGPPEDE